MADNTGRDVTDATIARRNFLVGAGLAGTAVAAGLAGGTTTAEAQAPTVSPAEEAALKRQLEQFRTALSSGNRASVGRFLPKADFLSEQGVVRGAEQVSAVAPLRLRSQADTTSIKWLSGDFALVDNVAEQNDNRSWFTEIWHKTGGEDFAISVSRARIGAPTTAFEALSRAAVSTGGDDVPASVSSAETPELQKQFKAFRAAFNEGNQQAMLALFTPDCDAHVVFSFIQGRAQVLSGHGGVGAKAQRMAASAVTNPVRARTAQRAGAVIAGEPKHVRFLSPTLAVVDGTAEISGIPAAHEFSPREMNGVYTDVWSKSAGGSWQIISTRPWF